MQVISAITWILLLALQTGTSVPAPGARVSKLVEFEREVKNIPISVLPLLSAPDPDANYCQVQGTLRYGRLPYRLSTDKPTSQDNYVHFQVAYPSDRSLPAVWIDSNRDRSVECKERLSMIQHPTLNHRAFRSFALRWETDDAPDRSSRY